MLPAPFEFEVETGFGTVFEARFGVEAGFEPELIALERFARLPFATQPFVWMPFGLERFVLLQLV